LKRIFLVIVALLVLSVALLTACAGGGVGVSASDEQSTPVATEIPNESPVEDLEEVAETTEITEAERENVIAQMAGFWRLDDPNSVNSAFMILSENGSWESPGFLPTDHVLSGSFDIVGEEPWYRLRFTVEQSTDSNAEIGHELATDYYYDIVTDVLMMVPDGGEWLTDVMVFRRVPDVDSIEEYRLKVDS